jgi:hypothetical protein
MSDTTRLVQFGIVSLEADPEGEHAAVALVAPANGPDYEMDMTTGEMEPVEKIDPNVELEMKMDIMMEINEIDDELIPVLVDGINLAPLPTEANPIVNPVAFTAPSSKLEAFDKALAGVKRNKNTNTPPKGTKMKAHQYLSQLIIDNPGISRTDVFQDPGLRVKLLSAAVMQKVANGDKLEVKRWNRRLNRFIRQMRRDGTDIQIERKGRVAHYTIGTPSGQLEIPFTPAAEARNSAIIGNDATVEELAAPVKIDFRRATEPENIELSFEDLLLTLDDEAVADVPKMSEK